MDIEYLHFQNDNSITSKVILFYSVPSFTQLTPKLSITQRKFSIEDRHSMYSAICDTSDEIHLADSADRNHNPNSHDEKSHRQSLYFIPDHSCSVYSNRNYDIELFQAWQSRLMDSGRKISQKIILKRKDKNSIRKRKMKVSKSFHNSIVPISLSTIKARTHKFDWSVFSEWKIIVG